MVDSIAPRIAIVGPLLPYRGGIAQYNTLLSREFSGQTRKSVFFSFSRQYPQWLYPGADDRDPSCANHIEPGARYTIDSLNPLSWLRTVRAIEEQAPGLVVFHWWTVFWAPCFAFMIRLLQRRGIRVALICHNLVDHDASGLKAALSRRVIGMADAYLAHSQAHADALRREWPGRPVVQHPIPVYEHYPAAKGTLEKRGRVELLFFGFIRPYKGLDVLLDALEVLADGEVHLTVIGEHWGDPRSLLRRVSGNPNISLHLHYMNDAAVAEHFHRADFVVLPYTAATPSAVASVAYHYDTPIIASRVPGLVDVVIDGRTGLLVPANNHLALADAIRAASRARSRELAHGVSEYRKTHDWHSLRAALEQLVPTE